MATAKDLMGVGLPAEQATRLGWQERSVATSAATQGSAGGLLVGRGNQLIQATFTTAADAITLPAAAAVGDEVLINNVTANAGVIFPQVGGNVNGETTNASMVIAAQGSSGCVMRCIKVSALRWAVFSCTVS